MKPAFSRPVILLASVWPQDTQKILSKIPSLIAKFQFLIVPHEPSENFLQSMEAQLKELTTLRFSQLEDFSGQDVVFVDKVGVLADLYAWSQLSFVGGSFGRGVHSVMESLVQGVPVLLGPHHFNNREAITYKDVPYHNSLMAVETVENGDEFLAKAKAFLETQGSQSRQALRAHFLTNKGASQKIAERILQASQNNP